MNMNVDDQVTIIEITADYLILIILGDKLSIDAMISDLEKNNPSDSTQYFSVKIDNPSANKCHELMKTINQNIDIENIDSNATDYHKIKSVVVDDGVESAQCYTYAEGYNNQSYMLMTMSEQDGKYILGYPKFELFLDEEDPEIIAENWLKKKIKKIPAGIRKNMKLITVVGTNANILVMATKITKKKDK